MELRRRISLGSSWAVSGDPQSVLFVRNSSSGILLDEPLESERPTNTPLSLVHPPCTTEDSTDRSPSPCYLYLDLHKFHGYLPSSIELVSESKTVEVYGGREEDYCSTGRGTLLSRDDDGQKLFSCVLDLPMDTVCDRISLKLLSLQGRKQVALSIVLINVTEDHGGSKDQAITSSTNSLQPEQLLTSLATHNLPPLLKNLVLSLQTISTKSSDSSNQGPSSISPRSPTQDVAKGHSSLPEDLLQMAKAFRHVHSTIAPPENSDSNTDKLSRDTDPKGQGSYEDDAQTPANECVGRSQPQVTEAMLEKSMYSLEKKLESYIDVKFVKLEHEINARFEELALRLLRTHPINGTTCEQDVTVPGITESVLVTDDNQLD